jgi:hypothetical protein
MGTIAPTKVRVLFFQGSGRDVQLAARPMESYKSQVWMIQSGDGDHRPYRGLTPRLDFLGKERWNRQRIRGFARREKERNQTKTAGISAVDGQRIEEGGVTMKTYTANRVVTEMPCGGKMTASKIHNKPVEKALGISSLSRCEDWLYLTERRNWVGHLRCKWLPLLSKVAYLAYALKN